MFHPSRTDQTRTLAFPPSRIRQTNLPPRLTTKLFAISDTIKTLSSMGVEKTKVNPA